MSNYFEPDQPEEKFFMSPIVDNRQKIIWEWIQRLIFKMTSSQEAYVTVVFSTCLYCLVLWFLASLFLVLFICTHALHSSLCYFNLTNVLLNCFYFSVFSWAFSPSSLSSIPFYLWLHIMTTLRVAEFTPTYCWTHPSVPFNKPPSCYPRVILRRK